MPPISINWWAVLVAMASNFVIGGIWYSPAVFLKPWMQIVRIDKTVFDSGLPKALVGDLFSSFLMAFVLVHAIRYAGANDLAHGLMVSFWIWLAFIAAVLISSATYEHRPFKYFAITAGYRLTAILAMGAILTLWK